MRPVEGLFSFDDVGLSQLAFSRVVISVRDEVGSGHFSRFRHAHDVED